MILASLLIAAVLIFWLLDGLVQMEERHARVASRASRH